MTYETCQKFMSVGRFILSVSEDPCDLVQAANEGYGAPGRKQIEVAEGKINLKRTIHSQDAFEI